MRVHHERVLGCVRLLACRVLCIRRYINLCDEHCVGRWSERSAGLEVDDKRKEKKKNRTLLYNCPMRIPWMLNEALGIDGGAKQQCKTLWACNIEMLNTGGKHSLELAFWLLAGAGTDYTWKPWRGLAIWTASATRWRAVR